MSFIAIKNFDIRKQRSKKASLLISAAKGDFAGVRLKLFNYASGLWKYDNAKFSPMEDIAGSIRRAIKKKGADDKDTEITKHTVAFMDKAKAILNAATDELPSEVVAKVLAEFKVMSQATGLGYIDIRNQLDHMLYSLTVKAMARYPQKAEFYLNSSMESLVASVKATDEFGLPMRPRYDVSHESNSRFYELKGLFELLNNPDLKRLDYGINENVPDEMVSSYIDSHKAILKNEDVLKNAKNILSIVDFYGIKPTGPSGMISEKFRPPKAVKEKLVEKLNHLLSRGDKDGIKKTLYRLRLESATTTLPVELIIRCPETVTLLSVAGFDYDFLTKAQSTLSTMRSDNSVGIYKRYLKNNHVVGPDLLIGDTLDERGKSNPLSFMERFPEIQKEIKDAWESAYPGAPMDAVVLSGKVYVLDEGVGFKLHTEKKSGMRL